MLVSRVMALSSSWNHVNVTVPPVPSINVDIQFARRHPVTRISHHRFAQIFVIAKMIKYMYDCHPKSSFSELVEMTVKELEGKVFPKINK